MNSFKTVFAFEGKIGRSQWWLTMILVIVAQNFILATENLALYPLLAITTWVWLSAMVRRNRDRGQSAWFLLFYLIPLVAFIGLGCLGSREPPKAETTNPNMKTTPPVSSMGNHAVMDQ